LGYYPEEGITYLGGGIDLSQFIPSEISSSRREEIRRSIGLATGDRIVGFIGRLVREKGLVELFEAYKSLKEKIPNLRLLIVGPMDPEKKDAISIGSERSRDGGYCFHGDAPGHSRHDIRDGRVCSSLLS